MWQAANDALPTNLFCFNRHITDDDSCSHCNLDVHESVMHVLHDCPCLGDFSLRLVKPIDWVYFFIASNHLWLASNLKGGHILATSDWPMFLVLLCIFSSALGMKKFFISLFYLQMSCFPSFGKFSMGICWLLILRFPSNSLVSGV